MPSMVAAYTLGDLLDEPDLGVELVVGDESARSLPILGAHSIEVEHPSRWLDRGWLVLTTGVRLRRNVPAQRELIAELDRLGAAAVAFGVGDVFQRVPRAMLDEARARDFPLLVIPLPTPFRSVIGAVYRATLSGDLRTFQRLTAMQRYLTDALGDELPLETVIERLAELVDASVGVLNASGELEASTGLLPRKGIWEQINSRPATLLDLETGNWRCVAAPIKTRSRGGERWLVIAGRRADLANDLTKAAAQATTPLLAALGKLDRVTRDRDRAIRAALLDGMLEAGDPVEQRSLAMRSAALGVDFKQPAKVLLIVPAVDHGDNAAVVDTADLADRVWRRVEEGQVPALATRHGTGLCLLAQGDSQRLRELAGDLVAAEPDVVVGSGREIGSPARIVASLRDARLAVERIGEHNGDRLLDFADFDLSALLVGSATPEWLLPKVDEMLAPLRENEPLLETVATYFSHDLNVVRTARALQIHPNSLRYRLGRVEALIGRSLRQPSTIAALHLSLLASFAEVSNGIDEARG